MAKKLLKLYDCSCALLSKFFLQKKNSTFQKLYDKILGQRINNY